MAVKTVEKETKIVSEQDKDAFLKEMTRLSELGYIADKTTFRHNIAINDNSIIHESYVIWMEKEV